MFVFCVCQFLIGKVKLLPLGYEMIIILEVSIPHRQGKTIANSYQCESGDVSIVSIPHRQGKTTAFSVIIITILAISSQIKLFLSKKSVDHTIIIFAEFLIKSAFQALFTIFSNCVQTSTDFFP